MPVQNVLLLLKIPILQQLDRYNNERLHHHLLFYLHVYHHQVHVLDDYINNQVLLVVDQLLKQVFEGLP